MDPHLLEAFDDAQARAIAALREVVQALQAGLSEADIAALARERCAAHGFDRFFHPPEVQVGRRTASNAVWKLPSRRIKLSSGQLVSIDIAPGDAEVCADAGTTTCFDCSSEPEVVSVARECTRATAGYASRWKTVGELFVYARAWTVNHRMRLASSRSIGHALLPREGPLAWDWPRSAHRLTWLRRHQVRFLNPRRVRGLWALRPVVADGELGASFEELVYVDGDDKRVLGRAGLAEIGTL